MRTFLFEKGISSNQHKEQRRSLFDQERDPTFRGRRDAQENDDEKGSYNEAAAFLK